MSIQKKNGKYVPVVYLGKDPVSGKKLYKWGRYWDKKKDAVKEEAELQLDKENQLRTFSHREMTFGEMSEQWRELIASQKYTAVTQETQKYILDKHLLPVFSAVKLHEITPLHVQKFLRSKSCLSAETQRKIIYLMKNILNSAITWEMITSNPCDKISLPKVVRKEKNTWTAEQVRAFLDWEDLKENKYYAMLLIAFHTGMRPGEITGLKWCDIEEDMLHLSLGLDKRKRATGLKTEGSKRIIYINQKISNALLEQRKWQIENKLLLGVST